MASTFHYRAGVLLTLFILSFVSISLHAEPDLELAYSIAPEAPTAGKDFVLQISIENKGDTAATSVTLTNHFPAPLLVKSYAGNPLEVVTEENFIYFTVGNLPAGAKATYEFTLHAPQDILVLTTSTRGTESESVLWNNLLTFQVEVGPAVTLPPTIAITSPLPSDLIAYGSQFTIAATASDSDGEIARVVFLVNGSAIGEDSEAPYQLLWKPLTYGTYELTVMAYDDLGASASASVSVEVAPPPKNKIVSIKVNSTTFELLAGSDPGRTSVLLSSEDLVTWEQVDSQLATEKTITFTGDFSGASSRFYRVTD